MASKSEIELGDEEDADTVRRPWYKRFAFWRAALPTLFSLLALGAALALLLVPQFHFTTTVRLCACGAAVFVPQFPLHHDGGAVVILPYDV